MEFDPGRIQVVLAVDAAYLCPGLGINLQLPMFCKRVDQRPGHDDVIQHAHVDQAQRLR